MELTASFRVLLDSFAPVFTEPSYATFCLLMTGWILSTRHRYVTDLIISSDSVGNGHFTDYHRFFSQAAWNIDELWKILAQLLVAVFVGDQGRILLAGDDTLCRKRGLSLFGAGMHHDPLISSRKKKLVRWGHDWVIVALIVVSPWWAPGKVLALPIGARLYRNRQGVTKGKGRAKLPAARASATKTAGRSEKRKRKLQKRAVRRDRRQAARQARKASSSPKAKAAPPSAPHRTRPELLRELLTLVASWFPERKLLVLVDSLYSGESVLQYLPKNMDLIGPVHPKAALYEPAPAPPAGRRGPHRKKGKRLPGLQAWADQPTRWTTFTFDQYGLHTTLEVKTTEGLYYTAGKDRLLTFVLSRDAEGERPTRIFYCTDLTLDLREILSFYSHRWAIEVAHYDVKQHLGFEDPANRTPLAVQRTAPMALFLYSLTVLWYHQDGHRHLQFPNRPWYPHKSEPSFADMLTTLRRQSWDEKLSPVQPRSTPWRKKLNLLKSLAALAG